MPTEWNETRAIPVNGIYQIAGTGHRKAIMPRRKVYVPPSLSEIGKRVNAVFDRHGAEAPFFSDPDVRQGFISFLWIAGKILAKNRTELERGGDPVDTQEK